MEEEAGGEGAEVVAGGWVEGKEATEKSNPSQGDIGKSDNTILTETNCAIRPTDTNERSNFQFALPDIVLLLDPSGGDFCVD